MVRFGKTGKGKGWKGKGGKGKKGSWFGFPYGGKGGYSKGGQKGKGKTGGKKRGKNQKGKGKSQHKGKGYGSSYNSCRICGQQGHWGNECPQKVNNVNAGGEVHGSDAASTDESSMTRRTSLTSSTGTQPSAKSSIKRVMLYNVATPPSSQPECYEVQSDADELD